MGTRFKQAEASLFTITTPLGEDKLLLKGFKGSEGMSRLFKFELDLLSEDNDIDFKKIIGQKVTISLRQANGKDRYFNGIISRFGQSGSDSNFTSYSAEMVPWLWCLTRNADCRIFQNKTVPDIIKEVFQSLGFTDFSEKLTGSYDSEEYCVQYRETSFNFVSRLMEDNGIFYFFEHELGKHTLVLGDSATASSDCPGQSTFRFYIDATSAMDEDVVNGWEVEQELRTGKYSLKDYNFETPSTSLLVNTPTADSVGGNSKYETYDYPGDYEEKGEGEKRSKIRMEEEESGHLVVNGTSDARSMVTGYKFNLTDHFRKDMNTSYLLTDIQHTAETTAYSTVKEDLVETYSNTFQCIPANVPFRPVRVTPGATVMGPQTAVVVGPSGEEIHTDKYGRVKVQFHWDRVGKNDDKSSCWIRVAQFWAGKNWGAIFTPRIGQEVIVDFLEGDPDHPLITGSVYNDALMPPYSLPANQTQSGILTRSSKGGAAANCNEIRFEDKKGSEQVFIHAEKDMQREVENDDSLTVGHDQTITIKHDRTEIVEQNETVTIKQGNREHTITQGNETLTVKTGDRLVEVSTGNDTHTVKTGNRTVEVKMGNDEHKIKMGNRNVEISLGNDSLKISVGNQTTKLDLGSISSEAMQGIELKVGQSSIKIDQMGVTIKGLMISVQGTVQTEVKGLLTSVKADTMLTCKGAITMIN
jgi:type VI secretion system secreted protein VgrG